MAMLEQLTDEERPRLLGSSSATPGAGPGASGALGPNAAAPTAPTSTQATPLSAYFTANQGAAQTQADNLTSGLQESALSALNADDLSGAQDVLADINAGPAAVMQEQAGPGYTGGLNQLDAYVMGRASPDAWSGLREQFGGVLGNVEAPPTILENPGARPGAINMPGAQQAWENPAQAAQQAQQRASGLGAQSDYDKQWEAYLKSIQDYNAWTERRNKNVEGVEGVEAKDRVSEPEARQEANPEPFRNPYASWFGKPLGARGER